MSDVNLLFPNAGLGTLFDESMLFCACETQQYAVNGVTLTWGQHRHLTWGTTIGNLGRIANADFKNLVDVIGKEFSKYADISLTYTANTSAANLLIVEAAIDGSSGILADCQMPVRPNAGTQLMLRIDKAENLVVSDHPNPGEIDAYTMLGHEIEHFWGLGHQPASIKKPARIQPFYNIAYRYLQQADIDELLRRYPEAVKPVEPAPTPVAPGSKPVGVRLDAKGITVWQDSKEWNLPMPGLVGKVELTLPRTKQ